MFPVSFFQEKSILMLIKKAFERPGGQPKKSVLEETNASPQSWFPDWKVECRGCQLSRVWVPP